MYFHHDNLTRNIPFCSLEEHPLWLDPCDRDDIASAKARCKRKNVFRIQSMQCPFAVSELAKQIWDIPAQMYWIPHSH